MEIYRLRDELADAIEIGKWKTAKNRARGILKLLPLAIDPSTSKTGTPHVDGVFTIGTQRLADATNGAGAVIEKMNAAIYEAKSKFKKKKKKKK